MRGLAQNFRRNFKSFVHSFELDVPEQPGMTRDKVIDVNWRGRLTNKVGHVEGVEVTCREEAVDGL